MSRENGSRTDKRTMSVRTEQVHSAPIPQKVRTAELSQDAKQSANSRTEQAPRGPAPLDVDGASRVLTARLLNETLKRHWAAREAWASNRCLADHYCENTESVIRRWRSGEKSIPLAALHLLPATLAEELARGVLKARGVDLRQAVGSLSEAIDAIEVPIADEDREETVTQLRDARDRIIARLDRLAAGAK